MSGVSEGGWRLAIEIGGTKLQWAVGRPGETTWALVERRTVRPEEGAAGIRRVLAEGIRAAQQRFALQCAGIGFGGPVDRRSGCTTKSHQIQGWEDFPLVAWFRDEFGLGAVIGNDCDVAALAEARSGAGQGRLSVFYVTVGSGIGGGFVVEGRPFGIDRPAIAEIGHLRPGLEATAPHQTVESIASGWAIARRARARLEQSGVDIAPAHRQDLMERCTGQLARLDTKVLAQAAESGNPLARAVIQEAVVALGWAIAQTVTLFAPEVVVVGGGVSLMSDCLFLEPLQAAVRRYVFPPLKETVCVKRAELGEEVVLHGALWLTELSPR